MTLPQVCRTPASPDAVGLSNKPTKPTTGTVSIGMTLSRGVIGHVLGLRSRTTQRPAGRKAFHSRWRQAMGVGFCKLPSGRGKLCRTARLCKTWLHLWLKAKAPRGPSKRQSTTLRNRDRRLRRVLRIADLNRQFLATTPGQVIVS